MNRAERRQAERARKVRCPMCHHKHTPEQGHFQPAKGGVRGYGKAAPIPPRPVLIATDEVGNRVELVGTPVDDTEREAAEQARKDAQMRLHARVVGLWLPGDQL